MAKLYTLLKADENQIRKIVTKELEQNAYSPLAHKDFIYAEGTVPVLLVAHYDTILEPPKFIKNDNGVLSGKKGLGADDRAGIYGILQLIKKHHCHVLFTGGEERGGIGATAFTKSGIKPDVNYIIELDRRGSNDAVYYDGESEEFEKFISSFGWKTAIGSYTDICELAPYLDVMGVNLSIGYQHEHTASETLDTTVMNQTIERVSKMFDGEKYVWKERAYTGMYGNLYRDYETSFDDTIWYVMYKDKAGQMLYEQAYGWNEVEAVGDFLLGHDDLTAGEIVDVIPEDYMDLERFDEVM